MSNLCYPVSLAEIEQWRQEHGTSIANANSRFMEFVILHCFAASAPLRNSVALKGGNALRLVYQTPRSTKDLDFSVDGEGIPDERDRLREVLDRALRRAEQRFGVKAKCQRVKRNPPGPNATHPTYDIGVGYQFPSDRYYHGFMDRKVSTVIPLEITFFDCVCAVSLHTLSPNESEAIRVCTLEDIVAEKLRALLQQKLRNRHRSQDVFDIACVMKRDTGELNRSKIGEYLRKKSVIRNVDVRKSAFDDETRDMAAFEYDKRLREQAGEHFIHFADAWNGVLSLVETLDIPD